MGDDHVTTEGGTPKQQLQRFEDLARKLLKVPKAEIDEAEQKRKKRRTRTSAQ